MADFIYMSAEGIAKLEAEIAHLRSVERPAVVQAIAEARDKGDLSENAEYDAAREAQAMLELKISKLEQTLARARAIDTSKIDLSKVQIYCRVKMRNLTLKRDMEYTLVAESEANVREGKLSIGTPIAQALIGKAVGDVVEVTVPSGVQTLEILEIGL